VVDPDMSRYEKMGQEALAAWAAEGGAAGAGSAAGIDWVGEEHESEGDKTFRRFRKRVARAPQQVLRYCWGGEPLWQSAVGQPQVTLPPGPPTIRLTLLGSSPCNLRQGRGARMSGGRAMYTVRRSTSLRDAGDARAAALSRRRICCTAGRRRYGLRCCCCLQVAIRTLLRPFTLHAATASSVVLPSCCLECTRAA
jgi:hypothetical protein